MNKPLKEILIASDVDGTITTNDTIFDFFDKYGKREEAEALNAQATGSDISIVLDQICRENKVAKSEFIDIANSAAIFPGAAEFYREMEELGAKILLLSASYEPTVERISQRLGIKQPIIRATEVKWSNDTAYRCGRVVEVEEKQKALLEVIQKNNMQLKKTVGIADSQSDQFFMNAIEEAGGLCVWSKRPNFSTIKKNILKLAGEDK